MKTYIAYYRVSTKRQGESGLGLEAQKQAVNLYAKNNGRILQEFTEVESGKKDKRPQLEQAINQCKQKEATLLIAKLDRLSRNVSFLFTLKESVNFVCLDLPDLNTLTLGIFATMAQHERELISKRTKAALQVKKSNGVKLGKPENLNYEAAVNGGIARKRAVWEDNNKVQIYEYIKMYIAANPDYLLKEISYNLNRLGYKRSGYITTDGKEFTPQNVWYLINYYKQENLL
jgi:DNA invertase Pin-like site-specific DNA recombinase